MFVFKVTGNTDVCVHGYREGHLCSQLQRMRLFVFTVPENVTVFTVPENVNVWVHSYRECDCLCSQLQRMMFVFKITGNEDACLQSYK
jgi:hypothetical protein